MNRSLSFRIFRRSAKSKKIYYARLFDQSGRLVKTISTGETNHYAAARWCEAYLAADEGKRENITFGELALDFWNPSGEFARSRKARGFTLSRTHLRIAESFTRNHVLPVWAAVPVHEMTTPRIDQWILDLHRKGELSSSTINRLLQIVRSILDMAVYKGLLKENPAARVRRVRRIARKRGILTNTEVKKLFASPWPDFKHYAINLLAFSTGARLGEIRALQVESVHPDRIDIFNTWEDGHGLKPPKCGSARIVPISGRVYGVVKRVIDETGAGPFVFYGRSKDKPIGAKTIENRFNKALQDIGITAEQRRERYVVFHSWRHKLNTLLRAQGVPDVKIRLLTGHKGAAMTDRYTNFTANDFTDVIGAQSFLEG